ncbi:hypothetical protein OK006_2800 [Actinobacteria bacterium OK006]|nr:hypothetical protein OK006_2800 [Actinobacteria bacterium OK006]
MGSADVIADVSDILVHVLTAAVRESDAHARVRLVELVGQQRGGGHGALGLELFLYEVAEDPSARNRPSRHTVALRSGVVRPSPGFSYDEQRAAAPGGRVTEQPGHRIPRHSPFRFSRAVAAHLSAAARIVRASHPRARKFLACFLPCGGCENGRQARDLRVFIRLINRTVRRNQSCPNLKRRVHRLASFSCVHSGEPADHRG